ncbi:MAG: helix-turn-helix domain-containing protein [Candidatus Gracilibacteria bacterium]
MNIQNYIKQALEIFGLTEGETRVYLALLQKGAMDVSLIKSETKYSTAGVYKIVNSLVGKGFVFPVEKSSPVSPACRTGRYIAIPLSNIGKKFAVHGRKMNRIADKFLELGKLSGISTETEVYEGDSLTDYYLDIPYKIDDTIWCVGSFGAVMNFFGPEIEKDFIKTRIKKGGNASALIFDETNVSRELAGRDKLEKRETKFIHNGQYPLEFSYLYGDTYLNFYRDSEDKIKVLKIDSPDLARAKLIQYQMMWNFTKILF